MASTKPGPEINLEEEVEGGGVAVDGSIFTPNSEPTSLLVCSSFFDDRDIDSNPYFPFPGPLSDSGSSSYSDSELDPYICPIEFLDRESSEADAVEYLESEGLAADDFNIWGFYEPKEDEDEEEIILGTRGVSGSGSGTVSDQHQGDSREQGLRVTNMDSDSNYEDDVVDGRTDDSGRVEVGTGLPPVWDNVFGVETMWPGEEWEMQSAMTVPELSSGSRISSRDDEEEHELDWQVLVTVNNVVNYIEQAEGIMIDPDDIDPNDYLYLASLDEYDDDDDIVGQMFDNESGNMGNPPAAKRVIENLPVVELTVEELNKGDTIVCAVCKDEMVLKEKVRRLPCKHIYHGECIMPWLGIRNTCPACRFELPTDDVEYERHSRSQRNGYSFFIAG